MPLYGTENKTSKEENYFCETMKKQGYSLSIIVNSVEKQKQKKNVFI